jgi:hypothetical protein
MMTPEDHKLIMTIWASHVKSLKSLIEILESRGVLEEEDVKAIDLAVDLQDQEVDWEIAASYYKLLTKLGIQLPELPRTSGAA